MGTGQWLNQNPLSPADSDRTGRVSSPFESARKVWGDFDDAREFILSRQTTLGGTPLDLAAASTAGARRAEALLVCIDHGLAV